MAKINCCNVACKHNNAILTKNENGDYDSDVCIGICNCEEDIVLIAYICDECGYENDGLKCKNFVFKDGINS